MIATIVRKVKLVNQIVSVRMCIYTKLRLLAASRRIQAGAMELAGVVRAVVELGGGRERGVCQKLLTSHIMSRPVSGVTTSPPPPPRPA